MRRLPTARLPVRLLLAALLAAACASDPPAVRVETAFGPVRAGTFEAAEAAARLVAEVDPRVTAMLPGAIRGPVEVWVVDELDPPEGRRSGGISAYTVTTIVTASGERSSVVHLPRATAREPAVLAHELAHARMGPEWSRLPDFLVEGVCEVVASRIDPVRTAAAVRRHRALAVLAAGRPLTVRVSPRLETGPAVELSHRVAPNRGLPDLYAANLGRGGGAAGWEEERVAYAVGYVLVAAIAERAGLEELHDLCRRAADEGRSRVPAEWVLAAAGVDGAFDEWLVGDLDPATLEEAAFLAAPGIASALLSGIGAAELAPDAESFLRRCRPRLRGGGTEIPLESVPAIRRALAAAWSD